MTQWALYPVTHGYETAFQGAGTDTPHYAVDIGTPTHTPLTAVLPGTVERADFQAWGGEIFIKPDDSRYPEYYYYHTDVNEVKPGQHVSAGQEIALSGGQTSGGYHPVTDGESTGPHTHLGWFTNYTTPSQTGFTIPYGPDPANLLQMAKGGGGQPSMVPSDVYSAVEPYAQQYHVPDPLWETVAYMESSFKPTAYNDSSGHAAVGLFQLLEDIGQGAGYSTAQLQDPATNARIGMPAISSTWKNLEASFDPNSLTWWEQFAAQSGHPGGSPGNTYTHQVAQTMMNDYHMFAGGSSSSSAATMSTTSDQQQCVPPSAAGVNINDINPIAWAQYWACMAQNAASGTAQQAAAGVAGWLGSTIGPMLLRTGVGIAGLALIYLGSREVVDALKDGEATQLIQGTSGNKRSRGGGGKRRQKKASESKPKTESKPKAASAESSKAASTGEVSPASTSAAVPAEAAAVAV